MNKSQVFLRVNRVAAELCALAREATVSDLHEAGHATGKPARLMSPQMRPMQKGARIAGPVITAHVAPGDNLMMHRALVLAQPGDVLVVVSDAPAAGAQWGDMATRFALKRGLAGVVVAGGVRDTDTVEALGMPVWATHVSPAHPDKSGHGRVNAPVVCDGVLVNPGDLVVADGDGVVVVSRHDAATVVDGALARMRKEDDMAKLVAEGATCWDLAGAAAIYATMAIEEVDAAFDDPSPAR